APAAPVRRADRDRCSRRVEVPDRRTGRRRDLHRWRRIRSAAPHRHPRIHMAQLALPHPVLTLLCGCALWHAPPREVLVHDALPEGTTIPPTFAGPAAAGEVANDWLASFDDPGMRAVVKEAIAYNLDLRAAAASVEIARETVTVVGAALLPQVGAVVGGTRTRDDEHGHAFNSQVEYVGVTWEIDLWGQLRAERAAAQAQ